MTIRVANTVEAGQGIEYAVDFITGETIAIAADNLGDRLNEWAVQGWEVKTSHMLPTDVSAVFVIIFQKANLEVETAPGTC